MVKNFFENKVILVTGASSGLGKTFANHFINKGSKVIVCSRRNKFRSKFYKNNKNFFFYKFDLNNINRIKLFVTKIKKKFKRIDILINNAGVAIPQSIDQLTAENLFKSFKVNFFSPSLITKEVLKIMKKHNFGRIVNLSSGGAVNCAQNYLSYSSSKAALNTLTKTVSKEVLNYDIKINSMSPGPCKTPMFPKNKLSTKFCLPTIDYLTSLNSKGPTGKFFWFLNEISIFPDLSKIDWSKPQKLKK